MDPGRPTEAEEPFWEEFDEEEAPEPKPTYFVADQIVGFLIIVSSLCGCILVAGAYNQFSKQVEQDRQLADSIRQMMSTGPVKDVDLPGFNYGESASSPTGLVAVAIALLLFNGLIGWGIYKSRRWAFGTSLALGCLSFVFAAANRDPNALGLVITAMFMFYSFLRITNAIGPKFETIANRPE